MRILMGAGLFLALCGTARADLTVSLLSEKGDFIGQGLTQTLNYTSGNFADSRPVDQRFSSWLPTASSLLTSLQRFEDGA